MPGIWDMAARVSTILSATTKSFPKCFASILGSQVMAPVDSPQAKSSIRRQILGVCFFLVVITWLVFGQTVRYDFVNYDDNEYVYANPAITSGASWQSTFVAALFAIHPLRVESVAWISERKDVLSAIFFMLTLGAYFHYARSPSLGRYVTMSIMFALGLLSKSMLVTVPFILLLLDYWPLERFGGRSSIKRLVLEKIPLLALSAAGGFVTLWVQQSSVARTEQLPLVSRIGNGLVSCVIYVKQMIWPVGLAVFYPHPGDQLPVWEVGLAIVLLGLVSAGVIALRHKQPYLVTGWFWYLTMLVPVIGLIQVGSQAHADRYTYLPQIGLYLLLAWAITDALTSPLQRRILAATASVAIIALAWCAHIQASYWRNGESLWGHALAVTSWNFMAHDGLGECLANRGHLDEAIDQFQLALNIAPGYREIETSYITTWETRCGKKVIRGAPSQRTKKHWRSRGAIPLHTITWELRSIRMAR